MSLCLFAGDYHFCLPQSTHITISNEAIYYELETFHRVCYKTWLINTQQILNHPNVLNIVLKLQTVDILPDVLNLKDYPASQSE